jgi:serine-type D-Ala-D-Ala carboxypeptidase/endopeptidase (penicillin-binding protein 4)
MRWRSITCLGTVVLTALFALATAIAQSPIAAPAELIAASGFAPGDVGFILMDVGTGQELDEHGADNLFLPGSVAKLVTAYSAERILGPDYKYSTRLLRRGADVYLQGEGNPALTANDLQILATELAEAMPGPSHGRFFYDDHALLPLPEVNESQPIATAYNAGFGALDVDFNRIEVIWSRRNGNLEFQSRSIADGLAVPTDWVSFAPASDDLPKGVQFIYAGQGDVDRWEYSKLLPDHGATFLPVRASGLHTALLFRELALSEGVSLPFPQRGRVPGDVALIGRVDSAPLTDILTGLLRYSNNPEAELIGLAASRKLTGQTLALGPSSQALSLWLSQQLPAADWRGFHLENHSGLSSKNRLSPRQMANLLLLIARDPTLMAALPVRDDDGGIAASTPSHDARFITGKSGTMDYARGLAGFFPAQDGRPLAFAIFVFDARQRANLDASMDRRIVEPSPTALAWTHRARALDDALLKAWMAKF